jgi:hypothetical protein
MHIKAAGLTAFLVLCWSSFAAAGPIADAAARAEAMQAEGKTVEALDALNEAVDAVWRDAALAFRTVALIDSASGFGVYEARAEPTFRPDEILTVYVEPVGFGYGSANGAGTIAFTADLAIENATGQVLSETEDVFSLSTPAAPGRREFYMALSFAVPFLRPGEYKAIFRVHDRNSAKTGSFEASFNVVLPVAE